MRNTALVLGALAFVTSAAPSPQKGLGGAGCKKVTFIFARGSTEGGTMGQTVGPALQRALEGKFPGQVTTMGVKYPASIQGAVSGAINPSDAEGSKDMTAKVKQVMASCPESKIILSGYSQGAEQVHGTLQKANLGPDGGKIAAAITYGDPMAGERTKPLGGWGCLPEERTQVFCNSGDGVCTGSFSISAAHLSYTTNGDIAKGAAFAAKVINSGKFEGVQGECKYGLSAASLGGAAGGAAGGAPKGGKGTGGAGGAPKGFGGPKSGGGTKGSGGIKGSGTGESSAPPPAAESAPAPVAGGSMADMPGMEGML